MILTNIQKAMKTTDATTEHIRN